jgi:hypothetical protein
MSKTMRFALMMVCGTGLLGLATAVLAIAGGVNP